ncbi:helix-turn-helix domain-containing protein [Pikeienuella sp. HZG-20]|uniref:helix-turn-helix domain-containing protein n=1 Tax=Paludibacillus litoralis TaxID=3133267 RepID=UPI0030EDBB2C
MTAGQRLPAAQRRLTGLRIRERRRRLGLKQNELAARVGVSAAYLNLIESNKRKIGGALLIRIGRELSLSPDQLDGLAERRLREDLIELAAEPGLTGADARPSAPEEFIARFPAWARAAATLHQRWRAATAEAEAMADRLAHDPALGAAVHEMLTEISALRSTAEILTEGRAVAPAQRRRFEQIMFEQSSRLAVTGAGLAAYFDDSASARRRPAPVGAAEEALSGGHELAEALEQMATTARATLAGDDFETALRKATPRPPDAPPDAGRAERLALLAPAYAAQTRRRALFDLAEPYAPAGEEDADEILVLIETELARRLADAMLAPASGFIALGRRLGWDVGALARALDGDAALAMRRIACLGALGAPRAAHIVADASGRVLERRGALDLLPLSRRLDCPVWPAHRAESGPPLARLLTHADGARALAIAVKRPSGMATDMLVLDPDAIEGAAYAALTAAGAAPPEPVGPDCRICAHDACPWRREPPITG